MSGPTQIYPFEATPEIQPWDQELPVPEPSSEEETGVDRRS
jgi:hypothetical protein